MNLTTLANVRQWVASQAGLTTDDGLLTRLIGDASQAALNYMQRPSIGYTNASETYSGRGQRRLMLRNWPAIAVSSLSIGGNTIPASVTPTTYGFFLEPTYGSIAGRPQALAIRGGGCANGYAVGAFPNGVGITALREGYSSLGLFPPGYGNITVDYTYGYCIQNEADIVANAAIAPQAPFGPYNSNISVVNASTGAALTAVGATPAQGQYVPPNLTGDNPTLTYTFNAADNGLAVFLSYNYVPSDLEQAVIEIVGERYRYKSRIGLQTTSLGGEETASYMVKDQLTASQMLRLKPFCLVWRG